MFGNLSTMGQVSGRDFAAKLSGMSNKEAKAELEEKRKKEEEEKRRQQEYIREQKAKEAERLRLASIAEKGRQQAPAYRDSYEVGELTSFEEAKQAADETYKQYWYDRANSISKNWTAADYALIANPAYARENVNRGKGRPIYKNVRQLPEGYEEYKEYQDRINAGPLDFSSEETHKMLINPPSNRGYGKRQSWISKDDPLRQAVEAQADVMEDFLDAEGISIVQEYPESFDRPDSFRGEGVYLNTGTGAHIDWDAGLKRMQQYQSSPDAELGTYSQVFVRPDPEGIAKPLNVLGAMTGNPWIGAAASLAAGGDIEDILKGAAKSYVVGKVTAPILEETVATLGVDADLFGMDSKEFSDTMMDAQSDILLGKDAGEVLLKEFGKEGLSAVANAIDIDLPDVDFKTPESIKAIGNALEPLVDVVQESGRIFDDRVLQPIKTGLEPVVDVAQQGIDVVQEAVQPISDFTSDVEDVVKESGRKFDDTVLQPVKEGVQAVTEPVVDVIDDIIDAVDSPLGDVLQAGGNLLGGLLGGLGGQQPQTVSRTPVEGLFDKELFKFDTEIKSTQEMLSPMMNSRRYG